jgi:polyphosphate glucokinase
MAAKRKRAKARTTTRSAGKKSRARSASAKTSGPRTLAVDVGGTGVKASVLDAAGNMMHERVRLETPDNPTPEELVEIVLQLATQLPEFDRVSVGFPGVIHNGVIRTAPNLGTDAFRGFDLAGALQRELAKPVQVMNDADMQGYAAVKDKGVEMVITLGTGFGTSIFLDGHLGPHMEFAHHPFRKGDTYEEQLGDEARRKAGTKRWSKRVLKAIDTLRDLTNFDHIYIGGGNAQRLDKSDLPPDASIVDNTAGILGGIRLWHDGTGSS